MKVPFMSDPRPVSAADRTNVADAANGRNSAGAAGRDQLQHARDILEEVREGPPPFGILVVPLSAEGSREEGGQGPDAVFEDPLGGGGEGERPGGGTHAERDGGTAR